MMRSIRKLSLRRSSRRGGTARAPASGPSACTGTARVVNLPGAWTNATSRIQTAPRTPRPQSMHQPQGDVHDGAPEQQSDGNSEEQDSAPEFDAAVITGGQAALTGRQNLKRQHGDRAKV